MRLAGLMAGVILLSSTLVPWTIVFITEREIGSIFTYQGYIFEFPFKAYYVILGPTGASSEWRGYEFTPRYLGIVFLIAGGILAVFGGLKERLRSLFELGTSLGVLSLIFFVAYTSAKVTIEYPLVQSYTIIPVGAFAPLLCCILVFLSALRSAAASRPATTLSCGNCGRSVSPGFKLCPFCGAELRKALCPGCGREVSAEHAFCPHCGTRLA